MTDIERPPSPNRRWRWIQAALLVVGFIGLAVAARSALADRRGDAVPGLAWLLIAYASAIASAICGSRVWVTLLEQPADRRELAATVYVSQLSKYLPAGGIVQAAGQIGMTATRHVPVRRVALAWLASSVTVVVGGAVIATLLVVVDSAPVWTRWLAPLGALAPLLLHRGALHRLVAAARRLSPRLPTPDDLPSQRALVGGLAWGLGNLACYGASFVVLLDAIEPSVPLLDVFVAFVVSWVVGFLAVPVPSGLGVREAVLVLLTPSLPTGALLAASLTQRLVVIAAEVTVAAGNRIARHLSS